MRSLFTHAILSLSSHSNSTIYDNSSYPQGPETGIMTPDTIVAFRFCGKWVVEVPQKNTRISNGRSTSTHLVIFVSRHSISTAYDHRTDPQGPKTSITIPNTIITFRFCCKWVFGVLQKIVKHLIEGPYQTILFYLCPGIVFQPHMTTGYTQRDLRQA